jgi:predicted RecB family nuclease
MHIDAALLRLSPSDLSSFLTCRHRTGLDLAVARGQLEKPEWNDSIVQALRDRGVEHEQAYVASLRAGGLQVIVIEAELDPVARARSTIDAMQHGAEVIVQAALRHEGWTGYADILRRVDLPSALGAWSYEPYDTKLARETRGGTILQLATYVDLLERLQGVRPERFHVVTPGRDFTIHSYRFSDFVARSCRDRRCALPGAGGAVRGVSLAAALQCPATQGRSSVFYRWQHAAASSRADAAGLSDARRGRDDAAADWVQAGTRLA